VSANQSNLSSTGFDYVVAVTQDSINATLEEYLYNGLSEVILCYVGEDENHLTPIDYATLVANANNTDPFAVPNGTAPGDPRVQDLNNANFWFAVKVKLGLPPGVLPASLAPIVVLKPGQSNVTYTLTFAEFVATSIVFGHRGPAAWVNQSQPSGTSWTFSGAVDLNFQDTAFTNLSSEAQKGLKDIGDPNMFSAQQLYYDLNSSNLEQDFQFDEVSSDDALNTFMTREFLNSYLKKLKDHDGNSEVLGYGVKQLPSTAPSSLAVTDLNFFTPDAVGKPDADGNRVPLMLNYLCATKNDALPGTTHAGFGWDWIEPSEVSQYDGVAAVNRNTFAGYLNNGGVANRGMLLDYAARNCYLPSVRVTYAGGIKAEVDYEWSMTPGQAPTVSFPSSGSTILSYSYDSGTASDQAGLNGDAGKLELSSTFDMTVQVRGNQLVIDQRLAIWTYVRYLATDDSGNVVDLQITDTYTIGVDDTGQIKATLESPRPVDRSTKPQANGFLNFWADVQSLSDNVSEWAKSCVATNLTDVPLTLVQNFVFPGGSTFSFTDAGFSDFQDFVSHITYVDVAAP
jgi:hypothetical protein